MTLEEIRDYRNKSNPFGVMLHAETVELALGYAKAVMPITDEMRNPQGAIHGGVLYTLADLAGGNAAASHGEWIATVDADMHYLRPALNLTGLVAEEISPEAVRKEIERYFSDPLIREKCIDNIRKVKKELSWETFCSGLTEFCNTL